MYLDPGFGGMLIQVIVAVVAVSGGILFSFRKKIRSLFSPKKIDSLPVNTTSENVPDDAIDMLDDVKK